MLKLNKQKPSLALSRMMQGERPSFLMNVPYSLAFDRPNNATMQSLSDSDRKLDLEVSLEQFGEFYQYLAGQGFVYLLPSVDGLQDQTYVSNVAAYLPHLAEQTIVLSNFRSQPRFDEELIAEPFLTSMGYDVVQAPEFFEGEADLKHLRDNIYFGAHGMRTSRTALDWMSENFDMQVIPIEIKDPYAYHLDCVLFPLDADQCLVCTSLLTKDEIEAIESSAQIIDVSYEAAMAMATNVVRTGSNLAAQTNISLYSRQDEAYQWEKEKIELLENVCADNSLELHLFDLSEFRKSGAALSCFVMKLS